MARSNTRINVDGLDAIIARLNATPRQIASAGRAETRKTINEARDKLRKDVARSHGLSVKSLRKRERVVSRMLASTGVLFFGTEPVPVTDRGKPKAVKKKLGGRTVPGVRVRGQFYENAFIATMPSGHVGVFRRVSPSQRKSAGAWSDNLPIEQVSIPLTTAEQHFETAETFVDNELTARIAARLVARYGRRD